MPRCRWCRGAIGEDAQTCAHCARPRLFPNVRFAARPKNTRVLARRYRADAAERVAAVTDLRELLRLHTKARGSARRALSARVRRAEVRLREAISLRIEAFSIARRHALPLERAIELGLQAAVGHPGSGDPLAAALLRTLAA